MNGNSLYLNLSDGRTPKFGEMDAALIKKLRADTLELRVKAMAITMLEMETYMKEQRELLVGRFSELMKSKRYKFRETGERIDDWNEILGIYNKPKKGTYLKAVLTGKETFDDASELLEKILDFIY